MKTLSKYFPLLLIVTFLFACSNSEEEVIEDVTRELKLSIAEEEAGNVTTENVDFEFEILDGNGEYTARASETDGDPHAKVTIAGNKVTVNLLVGNHQGAEVTITDKKNQKASLFITSTHQSLHIPNYSLLFDEGQTSIMDNINFGAGKPYTIEKVRGNASEATIENGNVKITSLGIGDTYYKVRDRRGSVARLLAQTSLQFNMTMTTNYLEFDGINNLTASITLKWGDKWEIIGSTNKITENISVGLLINSKPDEDYYVLFIHTTNEGKGTDTITLKDKDGNLAVVKVRVK